MDYLKVSPFLVLRPFFKNRSDLFHGQANVEHGFSLNKQLVIKNMSETSLIAQWFIKNHMLLNDYCPHGMTLLKS